MKKTLARDWSRVIMPSGFAYYWSHVSEYVISQVWRDGGYWRWAIVGFTAPRAPGPTPFIWRHGTAGSKNEACWYAEQAIPEMDADEQLALLLP